MEDLHAFTRLFIHDLRSPLGVIILNASWFPEEGTEEGRLVRKNKDVIMGQAQYMVDLIDKADRVFTLQSGKVEIVPARIDLVEFTGQILLEFNPAPERKVQFYPECDELIITTDPLRYREALIYLLENIVSFSQTSDPIEVQISRLERGEVSLAITDHWVGVPWEKQDRIFTPFNRIQNSPSSPDKGNGLGMYLAKIIIEDLLKGIVTFDASSGTESRYEIRMPVKYPDVTEIRKKIRQ